MATLDDLIKIDGVVAAGELTADGKLVDYKANMDMSREMSERRTMKRVRLATNILTSAPVKT
ncbi:MAG: DUF2173 family protein [Anaerolineales bacterium]|jgi:roadblock/LC7 domain-containing protein|nr:DUF2173 family protein [Anaerolineales bacterium]